MKVIYLEVVLMNVCSIAVGVYIGTGQAGKAGRAEVHSQPGPG